MQTVSLSTIKPAEPRSDPAFWTWSKLAGVSRSLSSSSGTEDPPGMIALNGRSSIMPPAKRSS
jgi:hypothetical protein